MIKRTLYCVCMCVCAFPAYDKLGRSAVLGEVERSDPRSEILVDDSAIRIALGKTTFDLGFKPLALAHQHLVLGVKRPIGCHAMLQQAEVVKVELLVVLIDVFIVFLPFVQVGRAHM